MRDAIRDVGQAFRTAPFFISFVLLTAGVAGFVGLMTFVMILQPGFLGMAHFGEVSHRVHDLTYGFIFTTGVTGVVVQLRRPTENVAGMVMAPIPWLALLLAAVFSGDAVVILSAERVLPAGLTLFVLLLHPAGRDFFASFRTLRINWAMLTMILIAAVPLALLTSDNIALQATLADDHAAMGHYGFMAAFGFTAIAIGLLASLRPDGWRLTAWVAGLLPALLGISSMIYPTSSSSLSPVWAIAAVVWGAVFVAVAELTKKSKSRGPIPSHGATTRPGRG